MDRLGSLLPKVLKQRGMYESAVASHVVSKANGWIAERFKGAAEGIRAQKLLDSMLTIGVQSSTLLMEMEQQKADLLAYLQAEIPGAVLGIKLMRT